MFRLPSLRITMFAVALTFLSELPLHGENILYLPTLQGANAVLGLALVNPTRSETPITLTARDYNGNIVQGAGIMNPVTLTISAMSQKALMATQIFGPGISAGTGWVELSTSNPAVTGFFLIFDSQLSFVDGAELIVEPSDRLLFPNVTPSSILTFVHTGSESQDVLVSMYGNNGSLVAQRALTLLALSGFSGTIGDLLPGTALPDGSLLIEPNSAAALPTLVGIETFKNLSDVAMVKASALSEQSRTGYFAHLVAQGGYESRITLVNPDSVPQTVSITAEGLAVLAVNSAGQTLPPVTVQRTIPAHGRMSESVTQMFNLPAIGLITGQIRYAVDANSNGLIGYADYGTTDGVVLASVAPQSNGYSDFLFSQVADGMGFYTGLAVLNANKGPATISLDTFDNTGRQTGSSVFTLQAGERRARLLRELLPNFSQVGGYAHLTSTRPVLTYEIFGSGESKFLANVPAQGNSLKPQPSGQIITSVDGANVFSPDGSSLIVPPFALNTDTKVDVSSLATQNLPRTSANEVPIGGVQAAPSRTQFDIPARLTFPLRLQANPGSQLVLLDYDAASGQYSRTPFFATVDESGRNASAEITQLASYVIAAPESSVAPMSGSSPINIVTDPSFDTSAVDSVAAASVSTNGASLANSKTMIRNSANFYKANPVQHLWNRCWTTAASCTAGGMGIGSFWMEFDFGAVYNLTSARLFGDAKGTWWSKTWTLQYKVNATDPWSTAFSGINAFFNNWSTQRLSTTARYVRVEVFGNPLTGDTEARELQIYGTPLGVNAASVNQPPAVNAGPAQTITLPSSATLNGTDEDDGLPVGSTLTVSWSKVSGPGTVTFGNANALSTTASFSAAGTYLLRLTASDSALSSTSDVTITVNAVPAVNQPPTVNAGAPQTITLPSSATLNGSATDDGLPAGSTLTTTWSKVSGLGTVTFGNANALSTTASFSAAGSYSFRLTASDSALSATSDVTITVNPTPSVNQPPTVNAGAAQTITLPASATLNGSATDDRLPSGSTLTTTWSKVSGPGTVTFGNANALSTTASFSAAGTYSLRLTASDSALSSTSDVTITVNAAPAVNQRPTVNAGAAQTITLPSSATLNGSATDDRLPSGSTLTTTWSKVSGPGTVTFSNANALSTTASFSAAGTYSLRLTASDGQLSSTSDVTVVVNPADSGLPSATPFKGVPLPIPGTIQAEDFDNGGEGVAYHDLTTGNPSGDNSYRTSDVDIKPSIGGGYQIGYIQPLEWLVYTVNVADTGTYTIQARVAGLYTGVFHIEFNGTDKTGAITIPNTGGYDTFQNVTVSNIDLVAGQQTMRVVFDSSPGGFLGDVDSFTITSGWVTPPPPIPAGAVTVNPGDNIQAIINAHGAGTSYYLKAGTYRQQSISPKNGDTYIGENGAILTGSKLVSSFTRSGSYWVATGQTQGPVIDPVADFGSNCFGDSPMCKYQNEFFIEDRKLKLVSSLASVVAGTFYFDYNSDAIYFVDDPTGKRVEASVTTYAFLNTGSGVTIQNLVIEKYANPSQTGVAINRGVGWILANNEIRLNHGGGLFLGPQSQIRNNSIHHNGQIGLMANGADIIVEGNEIAFNNDAGYRYDWEAGGTKFMYTRNLILRNNYSHDNRGPGLWTDYDNYFATIESNRSIRDKDCGIFQELSFDGTARYNIVEGTRSDFNPTSLWNNGAICTVDTRRANVYGNTVMGNAAGIIAIRSTRSPAAKSTGEITGLSDMNVHDNVIVQNGNIAAGAVDNNDPTIYTSQNNRYSNNWFKLSDPTMSNYQWLFGTGTRSQWQAVGEDVTGTWISPSNNSFPSIKFAEFNRVTTTAPTQVWSLPSTTNGTALGTQPTGVNGSITIIRGPIYTGGLWWWQVKWDSGLTGWSVESTISK